jgi:hypothetical protein
VQAFAFSAQDNSNRNFEIDFRVARLGAFVETHQTVA